MTVALLVGAGSVGEAAARHLAATPGLRTIRVADADEARARRLAEGLGAVGQAVEWAPDRPLPAGTDVVACALPGDLDVTVGERAVEGGVPVASCGESRASIERLLDLDAAAREAGVAVAVGAGLAPGLSEVLAGLAADGLDAVEEVHVARFGVAGRSCVRQRRAASWGHGLELRDGSWLELPAGRAVRLVYFPGPVGPHDCRRAAGGVPRLVVETVPDVRTATSRVAMRRSDRLTGRSAAIPGDGRLGAVFVEARGRRGSAREILTYGAVDRIESVTGAVLATAASVVAGAARGVERPVGAAPLAALAAPGALLAALARRGVRAASFEGSAATAGRP